MTVWSADRAADELATRLEEDHLAYAFGGALALAAWGVPRATLDVDVSVFVEVRQLDRVLDSFERAGALVDREDARRQVDRIGMFMASLRGVRLDIFLAHHPMHREMEQRRVALKAFGEVDRWFLSAEDVVLTKLIYRRPKDILDLERLFAVQPSLDVTYVSGWLRRIVGEDDERHAVLADLITRFGGSSPP